MIVSGFMSKTAAKSTHDHEESRSGAEAFGLTAMRVKLTVCHSMTMALRCLIVDDSARFLRAARLLLEREGGVVVDVASSAAEALVRTEALHPDVLLLDIELGGESGFELARRLDERSRQDGSKADALRIILISTHAERDFTELIADSPAIGFLSKTALSAGAIRDLLSGSG
jgi:CheY-like chemotaxis protein